MSHSTHIKIRGYHLDFYGHVNNARYLEFLEEARWAFLETGVDLGFWKRRGLGFVVAAVTINYRRPVTFGDTIEIRSRMTRLGGKSGVIHQEVYSGRSGERAADADVTFVVVDISSGKSVAIDGEIREQLVERQAQDSGEAE